MSFFKKHPLLILLILLAIVIVLLVSTVGRGNMTPVESVVGDVTSVPSSGFNRFTYNVGNWFRTVFGISDIQKENAELLARNIQLEGQLSNLSELEKENQRLRNLANYVENNGQYDIVSARVAGKSPGYWFTGFTINIGRDQGLMLGQVVVDYKGNLVGRISETGGNWSKVESIIDPNSHVSALVERTRDIVMVRGTATVTGNDDERLCEGYFIPLDNDLLPGDKIVTSGLDTGDGVLYPKGLTIGEVVSVDVSESSVERTASIQSQVSFSSIEEVAVIRGVTAKDVAEDLPASEEEEGSAETAPVQNEAGEGLQNSQTEEETEGAGLSPEGEEIIQDALDNGEEVAE